MKTHTENPADLAHELASAGISTATLSSPRTAGLPDKIRIRPFVLKDGTGFQIEQFRGPKAFHLNTDAAKLEELLTEWLGTGYARAEFATATGTVQVMANRRGELTSLRKAKQQPAGNPACAACAPANTPSGGPAPHNRTKNYILKEGIPVPFLVDLGVMTKEGTVINAKQDKFRQINRFLEFIADVLPELEKAVAGVDGNAARELSVVDFGCGKSYLTFAVYHYLSVLQGMKVRIVGLDLKEDVISHCSALAAKYVYDGLHFAVGDIAEYTGADSADMVITLHACDTATDFALAQAVRWNARVILSVPCCQHELNAQLAETQTGEKSPGRIVLAPAFKHGIIRERMAALFTDAMRAELLEAEGYRVQILEFIDMTHTPKNLLIRAIRKDRSIRKDRAVNDNHPPAENSSYTALRDFLGVRPTLESELAAPGDTDQGAS